MSLLALQLPGELPRLWRFAIRLTRHREDAQDLVQRSCVRALERQHQWNPQTPALPWLYSIVHSIWLNELAARQLRLVGRVDFDAAGDAVADLAAADPQMTLLYRQVVRAVEALPNPQRVVMLLVAVEGFSYREASDVLGVPIGTVMSRLSRARLAISERFADGTSKENSNAA